MKRTNPAYTTPIASSYTPAVVPSFTPFSLPSSSIANSSPYHATNPAAFQSPSYSVSSPVYPSSSIDASYSPRLSPRISNWSTSSPRVDVINSVAQKCQQWRRNGIQAKIRKNVHAQHQENQGSQTPSYSNTVTESNSSRSALFSIDHYLRRRHVFNLLDSDQIIRGIVYNKTEFGLIITISSVYTSLPICSTSDDLAPKLSSASIDREEDLTDIEELVIQGECHLSEISAQAPNTKSSTLRPPSSSPLIHDFSNNNTSYDRFNIGDVVKALVISVDVHSERVYLSMNQHRLRGTMTSQQHKLGLVKERQLAKAETVNSNASLNNYSVTHQASSTSSLQKAPCKCNKNKNNTRS